MNKIILGLLLLFILITPVLAATDPNQVWFRDQEGNLSSRIGYAKYYPSDEDTTAEVKYYGFLTCDSNWYIMQNDTSAESYRFFKGSGNYPANWISRSGLSYDYYSTIFKPQ
jgi:hypothetical protein